MLAARAAEMSIPFDQAMVLTAKQWMGIRSVRFTCVQEEGTRNFSGEVVERAQEDGKLILRLVSGDSLCIEDGGAAIPDPTIAPLG